MQQSLWDAETSRFYPSRQFLSDVSYAGKDGMQWDSVIGSYNMPVNLRLPYYQNYLSFSFATAEYGNFDKTVYRYFLEGKDEQWSDISENTTSDMYLNLSPGTYIFKVRSRGISGTWSKPAELQFTILPPWWQTWWAYTLYVLLFAVSLWSFSRYRSRSLQRQNKLLEEKITLRTRALNDSLSELKTTQAQLVQKEKLASLGELTAGIAHEIQNPLNFVNNLTEVSQELIEELREERKKPIRDEEVEEELLSDLEESLQKVSHHGQRAGSIVKSMLQHSQSSSGEKRPTDLNALADEYLRLAYHGLRAKDQAFTADLRLNLDTTLAPVDVAPQEIGRVLLNLYNNAFYAVRDKQRQSPAGYQPAVSVSTRRLESGQVEISVKDNGMGIPEGVQQKIFQPFFTTKPTGEGTGLGLSLSYDIVTKGHGGQIDVNTQYGEFTEFSIIFGQQISNQHPV